MSCHLLSKLWTFCHRIFQHICHVQSAFQRNVCICYTYFCKFVMFSGLLSKLRTFCHNIYEKILMALSEGKKQEISWESPFKWPLRISCHTRKWAEMGEFFGKMDRLLRWDERSQQSWTKNTRTKCHRLWDKILQWDGLSHCDKSSKFTRSECHNLGWTDTPSTLRRNVTVVKWHSRWFVGWTDSVGWNVAWSVCGWTDRQCTL